MYKLRLKEEGKIASWEQNFTLHESRWTTGFKTDCGRMTEQRFAPFWECNDANGKCKGHARWAQVFPAGYTIPHTRDARGVIVDHEKFVFDKTCGPQMNGETITECPYCS